MLRVTAAGGLSQGCPGRRRDGKIRLSAKRMMSGLLLRRTHVLEDHIKCADAIGSHKEDGASELAVALRNASVIHISYLALCQKLKRQLRCHYNRSF